MTGRSVAAAAAAVSAEESVVVLPPTFHVADSRSSAPIAPRSSSRVTTRILLPNHNNHTKKPAPTTTTAARPAYVGNGHRAYAAFPTPGAICPARTAEDNILYCASARGAECLLSACQFSTGGAWAATGRREVARQASPAACDAGRSTSPASCLSSGARRNSLSTTTPRWQWRCVRRDPRPRAREWAPMPTMRATPRAVRIPIAACSRPVGSVNRAPPLFGTRLRPQRAMRVAARARGRRLGRAPPPRGLAPRAAH